MKVVSNAGPLIALARIGHFDILNGLYGNIYIPEAVRQEVEIVGSGRPGSFEIKSSNYIHVQNVRDKTAVQLLRGKLDQGESEAIVLAIELKADLLLIDESLGRRIAEARGLKKTGTIGTLILAKKYNLIKSVTQLLDQLHIQGFHINPDLYLTARNMANEND